MPKKIIKQKLRNPKNIDSWIETSYIAVADNDKQASNPTIYMHGQLLDNNSVSQNNIQRNAVIENKIAKDAVTESKIADNNVTENKIAKNAVTTDKIANNNVTEDKLSAELRTKIESI